MKVCTCASTVHTVSTSQHRIVGVRRPWFGKPYVLIQADGEDKPVALAEGGTLTVTHNLLLESEAK